MGISVTRSDSNFTVRFPRLPSSDLRSTGAAFELAAADVSAHADHHSGLARAVFFSHRSLHTLLGQADFLAADEDDRVSIRSNSGGRRFRINSRVASASLSKGRHVQLSTPAKIRLRHLRPVANSSFDDVRYLVILSLYP